MKELDIKSNLSELCRVFGIDCYTKKTMMTMELRKTKEKRKPLYKFYGVSK